MYNPVKLKEECDKLEHGKSMIAGFRHAIKEADQNNDLTYQLFFRLELCYESVFFDDSMDMFIVFPEVLALIDKHPEIPSTPYSNVYKNGMEHVLWVYKWIINECMEYHQIPMEDCKRFAEDFKRRSLAYGYNLKPYYLCLYLFYKEIDKAYAEQCFHKFEETPRDRNADCAACDRNREIEYYLNRGNLKKAEELSADIENFKLTCGGGMSAWLRMKIQYMNYYFEQGDFETAERYCRMIERRRNAFKEYEQWESFLYCYSHTNIGRALKIYKEHWKEWLHLRCPRDAFIADKYICVFFLKLGESLPEGMVKLGFDQTFPLYREDEQYSAAELYDFYYQKALDTAEKFDQRNGTDGYKKQLLELLEKEKG